MIELISKIPERYAYDVYYPLEFKISPEEHQTLPIYEYTLYTRKDGSYFLNVRNRETKIRNKMFKHPKTDRWFFHYNDLDNKHFSVALDELYSIVKN